jgi:hypothetical protein
VKNRVFLAVLLILFINTMPVFAQDQIGSDIDNLIEGGVNEVTNTFTENIDLSSGNPLNTTQQETEHVAESGKGLFFAIVDLFRAVHEFATSMINFLSPYPVQGIVLFLVAGAITIVTVLSLLKRLAIHVFILILVVLVIVAIFVVFYY